MINMACISDLPYEILLKGASVKKSEEFIRENCDEVYHVPGGYSLAGVMLKGGKTIPIGVKGNSIYFQYVKPCKGLFVLKLDDAEEEIEKLRQGNYQ
ncbi:MULTISPECIES: DUF1894 domain-containing protein [Methanohalophilus]|uniref:DUF1894 domain-containing protein n=4 Tax=Methanohalophilus TaxID=2175 RepID=A0A1H2QN37_9EURY|nr:MULTISPECIES: DUF1894 domain-containing protein [Methanohalophilus]OJH49679.1 hypothetical protein MPF_0467 [Methanohalophilus portucalensis FDF-1]RNI10672.1 DUF1894 domain-containing protein [Methanohalophilus halophilus]RNI13484.1 DUF1894 domain-containing protein [Methanohalophilus portucalensis FDF-1]SDW08572.1 hypothetical protein SAMN04515625_0309 [Methanohalophilus halophilus]SMH34679.1 hypothetical protein SAMN06264941_0871 [Methanohalophilus portucalensis FDF-1]